MPLPKHYSPQEAEPRLLAQWQRSGIYHFDPASPAPVYSIDTPPPTVSGHLHLGHVYSYSHADFIARFQRMNGRNVFYPMGYDDNGLPTERLVEKRLGLTAAQIGRSAFIEKCLQVSEEAEGDYQTLWQRLGLSIDWRYTYRTIDERSRRACQLSFIDLQRRGLAYRRQAPAIWCPECRTSIAQAELNDLERPSEFTTLAFRLEDGAPLPIATTRPELLPACVAVFVHPDDPRYRGLVGRRAAVPLFGQSVPILADPGADPEKGSGAVMCCTFGDTADVAWWYAHHLPQVEAIRRDGRMTSAAGPYAGLTTSEARRQIVQALAQAGLILAQQTIQQSVRVHERCDTPVEYIPVRQWFIRLLDFKPELLRAGEQVRWHPEHMLARYQAWVENLNWDWCLSRQRTYGVPFPVWYCARCGAVILADEDQLPVDPTESQPAHPCACGSTEFTPELDIFDTWATSSLSPQIVGQQLDDPALYAKVFPFSLRPQAHEIIRTWAFYTIVKSHHHSGQTPWQDALISGWGLAGEGSGKISKSRGGGPMPPLEMIERYSADAVRYWAASAGPGRDAVISEEKIQAGARLVTKLWNVARFSQRFLEGYTPPQTPPALSPADRWLLASLQALVRRVTSLFQEYDYASARSESEDFFWRVLADNYLEMAKQRLYDEAHPQREGARYALYHSLLALLKLFAPLLPYITETIYQGLFVADRATRQEPLGRPYPDESIHTSAWPVPDPRLDDERAQALGETLVQIATAVRRYKSEHNLPLGTELSRLQLSAGDAHQADALAAAIPDLTSVCRVQLVEIQHIPDAEPLELQIRIEP
ncbi:MAG: valine--tRNA ligase [Anaerolineales bacterium]|nr:valine--tRNA ligase [Anaerolineales bacterium]